MLEGVRRWIKWFRKLLAVVPNRRKMGRRSAGQTVLNAGDEAAGGSIDGGGGGSGDADADFAAVSKEADQKPRPQIKKLLDAVEKTQLLQSDADPTHRRCQNVCKIKGWTAPFFDELEKIARASERVK